MATRHLMALDYADYQAENILKKHARNRPLGDLEHRHNYIPAQPVLSCRTVDIDLPGTRTYRPRSTVDILEEQQLLIRQLYNNKQRSTASAPPNRRLESSSRVSPDNFQRVNIEVKGRPLTSSSQINYGNSRDDRSRVKSKRPKTTGHLKNVQPVTDSFMVVKFDQDLLQSSKNKRNATNQIHNYWKSENHNLATGKFVRGQKRPDDVPPTLDAWLTFGGAAGQESQGLIDAFANFKNSEEYYNIEGSVGSRVAKQLQKGDKIRIGINGILQSRDLKIKKRYKEDDDDDEDDKLKDELPKEKETKVESEPELDQKPDQGEAIDVHQDEANSDGEFKELAIDDDLNELLAEADAQGNQEEEIPSPKEEPAPKETIPIPLSWDDQCSKPDVKVLSARVNVRKGKGPVMSETHPVKFEKFGLSEMPHRITQQRQDGFKVKQRSSGVKSKKPGQGSSSKVKVVYIDPLNQEEEEKVNALSIEEIINDKCNNNTKSSTKKSERMGRTNEAVSPATMGDLEIFHAGPRSQPTRHISRSRPSSNCSDRSIRIPSPKFKTQPLNSSHHPAMAGNLSITTAATSYTPPLNEMPRSAKAHGRNSPNRAHNKTGGCSSGSQMKGETEYIKITSKLKISSTDHQQLSHSLFDYRPGSNTPQDRVRSPYSTDAEILDPKHEGPYNDKVYFPEPGSENEQDQPLSQDILNNLSADRENERIPEDCNNSHLSESPAPTNVAISIPTADELSDKDSLTSPSRPLANADDNLTAFQKRERNLRNEQIDQLTDLLGNAVVDP